MKLINFFLNFKVHLELSTIKLDYVVYCCQRFYFFVGTSVDFGKDNNKDDIVYER